MVSAFGNAETPLLVREARKVTLTDRIDNVHLGRSSRRFFGLDIDYPTRPSHRRQRGTGAALRSYTTHGPLPLLSLDSFRVERHLY